tara:strand:- start:189 stop:416 length:228 start_codon:yes stop_codon:yes gene_type:complete
MSELNVHLNEKQMQTLRGLGYFTKRELKDIASLKTETFNLCDSNNIVFELNKDGHFVNTGRSFYKSLKDKGVPNA